MSYLTNIYSKRSTSKSKKFELYVLKNKDTSHQNKQYKQNKKEFRMKHNDFLLNFSFRFSEFEF